MKIAIITDTHYGFKKGNKLFHDYFSKFYNDIFFPYLIKNKIKTVIHLGDAFDNRKGIDYWSLRWARNNVYDTFEKLGITVYNIVGNHDIYYKNTNNLNSVSYLLSEYDNVIKIERPEEFNIGGLDILMVPWINQENQQETLRMIQNSTCKVSMGHLELNGFKVSHNLIMEHGLDPLTFDKFEKVFSGHYHTRSNNGKVYYLGNPYQMFWVDYNDKRGFTIFDTETLEHFHIDNPYQIFKIINYTDNTEVDINEYQDCVVKMIVKEKNDKVRYEKFVNQFLNLNLYDFKVIEETVVNDITDDGYVTGEDTLTLLKKYVDESENRLNKNKIKQLINQIYQESYQV
jgi:DNA repair exonuclease SbcCD nuclease subunit